VCSSDLNRNFYFDVYIMNAIDGKIVKKLIEGNRSNEFEQLNILTPGLDWSPDGKKIVLSAKSSGWDVIYIIDVEDEDREILPVHLDGISSVKWSRNGKYLSFIGHDGAQSDIYTYNLETKEIKNITNDIFSDKDPAWSMDNKLIYFVSDRGEVNTSFARTDTFHISRFNFQQSDIYSFNIENGEIKKITNTPEIEEYSPVISPDGQEILYISTLNGINNIYKQRLYLNPKDSVENVFDEPVGEILHSLGHALANRGRLGHYGGFKGKIQLFVVSALQALGGGVGGHLLPELIHQALALFLHELAVRPELGVSVIIDLKAPGYHLEGRGHVGLGGSGFCRYGLQFFRGVAAGSMLGAGNRVGP